MFKGGFKGGMVHINVCRFELLCSISFKLCVVYHALCMLLLMVSCRLKAPLTP